MATTPKPKTGRKQKHHETADGRQIYGLSKRPSDGRWRIIGTQITFSEPDEEKAIKKFYELRPSSEPAEAVVARLKPSQRAMTEEDIWRYVVQQLETRPAYVAEMTGKPQLEWWRSWQKPEKLPTLAEIKNNWVTHKRSGKEQKSKVVTYWTDFVEFSKIQSIEEITPQLAIDYQDYIYTEDYAPKTQSHIFNGIRSILHFARSRAMAIQAMAKAIECLKLMKPSDPIGNNKPKPISVANFHALLAVVEGDDPCDLIQSGLRFVHRLIHQDQLESERALQAGLDHL
jgi:hypothetical protein